MVGRGCKLSSVGGTGSDRYRGWAQGSEVHMLHSACKRHRLTESYLGSQKLEGRSALKKNARPINVGIGDLLQFSWPLTALTSITHRIAGVALFVAFGFALYALEQSLGSAEGFAQVQMMLAGPVAKGILWISLAALIYHFVAGIKHLLLDGSDAESLEVGRAAAITTIAVSVLLIALMSYWVI